MQWIIYLASGVVGFFSAFLLTWLFKSSSYTVKEIVVHGDVDSIGAKVAQALESLSLGNLEKEVVQDCSVSINGKPVNGYRFRIHSGPYEEIVQVRADITYPVSKTVKITVVGKNKKSLIKYLQSKL
jgi:hypothetical protein